MGPYLVVIYNVVAEGREINSECMKCRNSRILCTFKGKNVNFNYFLCKIRRRRKKKKKLRYVKK